VIFRELKTQYFSSGRAFCGFHHCFGLKNFHIKSLMIGKRYCEYFRIKPTEKIAKETYVIYSTIAALPMVLIPT